MLESRTIILMDTPYRMTKLLEEVTSFFEKRLIFLGLNLNSSEELLLRGRPGKILKQLKDLGRKKDEFILIIAG